MNVRTSLAWLIRDAGYALADKIDDAGASVVAAVRRVEVAARIRGKASRLGSKVMPCGCEPTDHRLFCSRKRPPLPGGYFQRDCDCACHEKGAAK